MTNRKFLSSRRSWGDWIGIALGIVIALAPWLTRETGNQSAILNAAIAGIVVIMLAELDLVHVRRWAEAGQLVCGLWIATSSLLFGYSGSGTLRFWHLVVGLLVALLGAFELWQNRISDQDQEGEHHC